MNIRLTTDVPHIHIHRMRPIQIHIQVDRRLIRRPQRVRIIRVQFYSMWLCVLTQPIQRRRFRQLC
ncbi:hypothetical protein HanIR_Chr16g0840721 [Helianthus annuus]|nr:hypothetical protein HanIR_Chr16g0840721 [Helianthus annuus]